jgi:hypothetical protein
MLRCIKHPSYLGNKVPNLECKVCCKMYAITLKEQGEREREAQAAAQHVAQVTHRPEWDVR